MITGKVTMNTPPHPRGGQQQQQPQSVAAASEYEADEPNDAAAQVQAKASDGPVTVTDSRGRRLRLRELSLLQECDLLASMPPTHSQQPWVQGYARLAAQVEAIDDEVMGIPVNPVQYRLMIHRVGREGISAVIVATMPAEGEQDQGTELAKN
jgi:hypothetical protein